MEKANVARALTSYEERQRGQCVARTGLRIGRQLSQTGYGEAYSEMVQPVEAAVAKRQRTTK